MMHRGNDIIAAAQSRIFRADARADRRGVLGFAATTSRDLNLGLVARVLQFSGGKIAPPRDRRHMPRLIKSECVIHVLEIIILYELCGRHS